MNYSIPSNQVALFKALEPFNFIETTFYEKKLKYNHFSAERNTLENKKTLIIWRERSLWAFETPRNFEAMVKSRLVKMEKSKQDIFLY